MSSSRPSSLTDERADPMTRCPTTWLKEKIAIVDGFGSSIVINLRTLSVGQRPSQSWYSGLSGLSGRAEQDELLPRKLHRAVLCPRWLATRLRQPPACPWTQCLLTATALLLRRNRACDLIFTRDRQRCGEGASRESPVHSRHNPHPQLPT